MKQFQNPCECGDVNRVVSFSKRSYIYKLLAEECVMSVG